MAVSISVVVLLLVLVAVFVRNKALKAGHALLCVLLGFFLAGSAVGPAIDNAATATADLVAGLKP
ncbi:hypothetical protein ACIQU5_28650 [Streptomyces sp. NPDC090306]|uniref:hypothetical protein n=1 Tax=unclassified Streptomyces TaxID=2593676 RepID=UPI0036E439C5